MQTTLSYFSFFLASFLILNGGSVYATISSSAIAELATARTSFFKNSKSNPNFLNEMENRLREYTNPIELVSRYSEALGSENVIERKSWVFMPKNGYVPKTKVPVMVHLHGGPYKFPFGPKKSALELLYFASRGFMIFGLNYRGTFVDEERFKNDYAAQSHDVYNCTADLIRQLKEKGWDIGPVYLNGYDHGGLVAIHLLSKSYSASLAQPLPGKPYKNIFDAVALFSVSYHHIEKLFPETPQEVPMYLVAGIKQATGFASFGRIVSTLQESGRDLSTIELNCEYHIVTEGMVDGVDPIFKAFIEGYNAFVEKVDTKWTLYHQIFKDSSFKIRDGAVCFRITKEMIDLLADQKAALESLLSYCDGDASNGRKFSFLLLDKSIRKLLLSTEPARAIQLFQRNNGTNCFSIKNFKTAFGDVSELYENVLPDCFYKNNSPFTGLLSSDLVNLNPLVWYHLREKHPQPDFGLDKDQLLLAIKDQSNPTIHAQFLSALAENFIYLPDQCLQLDGPERKLIAAKMTTPLHRFILVAMNSKIYLDNEECSVCLNHLGQEDDDSRKELGQSPPISLLNCGHVFHHKCIQNINDCPNCRTQINNGPSLLLPVADYLTACSDGKHREVELVLSKFPNLLNANQGNTCLYRAISNGKTELAKFLLKKGAKTDLDLDQWNMELKARLGVLQNQQ